MRTFKKVSEKKKIFPKSRLFYVKSILFWESFVILSLDLGLMSTWFVLYQCFFTVYAKKTFHFLFTIVGGKSACPAVRYAALAPELTTYMQRCVRSVHYDGWRQMPGQCVGAGHYPPHVHPALHGRQVDEAPAARPATSARAIRPSSASRPTMWDLGNKILAIIVRIIAIIPQIIAIIFHDGAYHLWPSSFKLTPNCVHRACVNWINENRIRRKIRIKSK